MSRWDNFKWVREEQSSNRGTANASFAYTFYFPSNVDRLWDMLCFGERDIWSLADLNDLSRFVEDFVLCDHVGVARELLDKLGPHVFNEFSNAEVFPLFEFGDQLEAGLLAAYRQTADQQVGQEEQAPSPTLTPPVLASGDRASHRPASAPQISGLRPEDSIGIQITATKRQYGRGIPPLSRRLDKIGLNKLYIEELTRKYRDPERDLQELILKREALESESLQQTQKSNELTRRANELILEKGVRYPTGLHKDAERHFFFTKLADACKENGISISPGYALRDYFLETPIKRPLAHRLYGEVSAVHKDQLALLEKWSEPRPYEVPPLLSILLTQAKNRENLLKALIDLRERFGDLRAAMHASKASLSEDLPLRDRLDAVRQLESVRGEILKRAVLRPTTTIVRRTWSIVKKGSLFGAFTGLADIILEWDEERRLVGGLRHFVDLERLALAANDDAKNLFRLFGNVSR